jgi:glutamate-1-semialdehyde 2,1-aminomutase
VTPDIATFAKGVAAGFPVSVIAGKRAYMERFGDLSILHAGTYNSNAPCMAAVLAALAALSADGGAVYAQIRAHGERLMNGILEAGRRRGKPVSVRGYPPVFSVTFGHTEPVTDYRSFLQRDIAMQRRYFRLLQDRGVRTTPDQLYFVSTAHTEADIEQTLEAVDSAMAAL